MALNLLKRAEKGSALSTTDHDNNFTNIESEVNSKLAAADIASGAITPRSGALDLSGGSTGDLLTVQADGSLAIEAPAGGGGGGGLNNVVEDVSPQLGGPLDVNGQSITSVSNGNVTLDPNGTGIISLGATVVEIERKLQHVLDTDTWIIFGDAGNDISFGTGDVVRLSLNDSGMRVGTAGARATIIRDEDDMSSNDATALATQQSIKAYVDNNLLDDSNRTVVLSMSADETATLTDTTLSTSSPYSVPSGHLGTFFGGHNATIQLTSMAVTVNPDGTRNQRRWGIFCDGAVLSLALDVPSGVTIKWNSVEQAGPTTKALDVDRFYTILLRSDDTYEIWSADPSPSSASEFNLGDIGNVVITSVGNNEVLAFNTGSGEWINQTAAEAGLATFTQGGKADTALQPADIATGTITPRADDLNLSGGADGEVLTVQADGSAAFEAAGAHTHVVADITDAGALASLNSVAAGQIDADAVGPSELAPTAVTPGAYTNADITVDQEGRITAAASGDPVVEVISLAASDETTDLTTGGPKVTFRMPFAMTLTAVRASVTTAPTDAALIVDINEGGVSILSTKLSIDAGEKTSMTAAAAAVISDSALADDAEITIDIDQIGSTVAGAGLKVQLHGARA